MKDVNENGIDRKQFLDGIKCKSFAEHCSHTPNRVESWKAIDIDVQLLLQWSAVGILHVPEGSIPHFVISQLCWARWTTVGGFKKDSILIGPRIGMDSILTHFMITSLAENDLPANLDTLSAALKLASILSRCWGLALVSYVSIMPALRHNTFRAPIGLLQWNKLE